MLTHVSATAIWAHIVVSPEDKMERGNSLRGKGVPIQCQQELSSDLTRATSFCKQNFTGTKLKKHQYACTEFIWWNTVDSLLTDTSIRQICKMRNLDFIWLSWRRVSLKDGHYVSLPKMSVF